MPSALRSVEVLRGTFVHALAFVPVIGGIDMRTVIDDLLPVSRPCLLQPWNLSKLSLLSLRKFPVFDLIKYFVLRITPAPGIQQHW